MAKKKTAFVPPYSRYQQWLDEGADYWKGVSLLNMVNKLPHLRHTLNQRKSPYNQAKLKYVLKVHCSGMLGERPTPTPSGPAGLVPLGTRGTAAPSGAKGQQGVDSPLTTHHSPLVAEPPWTESKLKLPPFAKLPDTLKKARLHWIEKHDRALALHWALQELLPKPWSGMVHLRDALRLMYQRNPEAGMLPFNAVRYTFDRKKREGGRMIELEGAVMLVEDALPNPRDLRAPRRKGDARVAQSSPPRDAGVVKPGDHFRNATRDMLLPDGSKHRTIIWTLMRVNDMRVVLGSPKRKDLEALGHFSKLDREKLLDELVATMDGVCVAWDIERRWAETGALPDLPQDSRARYMAMPMHKIQNVITNSLRPKVTRWKGYADERDGDDLIEAQMTLGAAEAELQMALEVLRTKEEASKQ